MAKNLRIGAISLIVGIAMVSVSLTNNLSNNQNKFVGLEYYNSISSDLIGNELADELHDLLISNHHTYNTYGDVGSGNLQLEADKDFNNEGNIIDFYTQTTLVGPWDSGKTYNREHVWPKSLSNGLYTSVGNNDRGAGADLLSIRPSIPNINSSRNNQKYGDLDSPAAYIKTYNGMDFGYSQNDVFEPLDHVKGDVARIILYTYIHYSTTVGTLTNSYTGELNITDVIEESSEAAAFELLLEWHELDPVNDLEEYRNEYAETEIGVRNPFVDQPIYLNKICDPDFVVEPPTSEPSTSTSLPSPSVSESTPPTSEPEDNNQNTFQDFLNDNYILIISVAGGVLTILSTIIVVVRKHGKKRR